MSHLAELEMIAYWAREGDPAPVEDHAFACDACARSLERFGAIARAIPDAVRRGLTTGAIAGLVARMERDGLRARHYRLAPGGSVQCTITPDDDLLVAWFTADLANAARVDATWTMNGVPIGRFEDIAIDRAHELAIISIDGAMAKAWPDHVAIVTLVAVDDGADRPLAAYTFDHTAFKAPA